MRNLPSSKSQYVEIALHSTLTLPLLLSPSITPLSPDFPFHPKIVFEKHASIDMAWLYREDNFPEGGCNSQLCKCPERKYQIV